MKYKLTKLKNGLRVIAVPMASMESATVTVWVKVGSRFETPKTSGLSHFLEHIVFKGSKKRPSAKAISTAIDSFGGEFNASTSKEWTDFYIKAPVTRIDTACDVLADMVLNPLIKSSDVEREKGVICEEIAMYEDTPIAKIEDYFENLIYSGNSLGRDIAGTKDTIRGISRNDFLRYRTMYYGSNNVVVTIAGGISEKRALGLAEKYFGDLKKVDQKKAKKFAYKYTKPRVNLVSRKIEQAHLILGFFGNKRNLKTKYAEAVLASILGGGMSSRMFTEVREKRGLAYAVKTSADHLTDCGYLSTYAGVDLKRVDEAIRVILKEYYDISRQPSDISQKEFKKAKEYIKGHLALSLEDTTAVNSFFGLRELLDEEIELPETIYKKIDDVTIDEVLAVAKDLFKPEKLNLAITGPFKNKGRFQRLIV